MTKRRSFRLSRLGRLAIPLVLLLAGGVALAQVSANYNLSWNLLSGGGGSRASTGYRVDDSLGQWPGNPSASTAYRVDPGFWPGVGAGGGGALPTATPTATPGPTPPAGSDAFETDNACGQAKTITTDASVQAHNFYAAGDYDWVKFSALGNRTYNILVDNAGADADAVLVLYDACAEAPLSQNYNAFGPQVQLQWSAATAGVYYLQLFQNDLAVSGSATNYNLSVSVDSTPPIAPRSVRLAPADSRLIVQWRQSAEPDVTRYRVRWGTNEGGPYGSVDEIDGAGNTYYEIPGLVNDTAYYVVVHAIDYSNNVSQASVEVGDIPKETSDPTLPSLAMNLPGSGGTYTTTAASIAVGGFASDAGGNLSRAKAYNSAGSGATVWQNGLSGSAITFTVPSVPLQVGANSIQLRVYDAVSNAATANVTVIRQPPGNGVAVIIGGHNESYGLQTKINNLTNRAYRIFVEAGFDPAKIRYLAPSALDADSDGDNDVYTHTTTAAITATLQWAATQVGSGTPFFLYLMDHGMSEAFCADGCPPSGDGLTPDVLNGLLDGIETAGGAVNVIIEACLSGSFIDDPHSISKAGRVIISSTSADQNAYASAQGAYFSDAFYSSAASGASLLTAFNAGKAAVAAASVNQAPWLDDNHSHSYDGSDGGTAGLRYLSTNFGTVPPYIATATVGGAGSSRVISATVLPGDAAVHSVWAAVFAPSFQEPTGNTLDLGVPLVELLPNLEATNLYTATYSGFSEAGTYRVVVYAADTSQNEAAPRVVGGSGTKVYLPLVTRSSAASTAGQGNAAPQPSPSPTATATAAPSVTATPAASPTPTASPTAEATATAAPTAAPTSAPTPMSTVTLEPTVAPPPPAKRSPAPTRELAPGREGAGYLPMVVRLA